MRKVTVFSLILAGFTCIANAADLPSQRRGVSTVSSNEVVNNVSAPVSSARAAVRATAPSAPVAQTVSARAAARGGVINKNPVPVNSESAAVPAAAPVVSARAATSQKVIGSGTKIVGAVKNTVVNEDCQQKFNGCMDAFCMVANDNGGRCSCSDRKSELDKVLAEIQNLDSKSYKMATEGVETLEMGENADKIAATANAAAKRIMESDEDAAKTTNKRKTVDLSAWQNAISDDADENIFDDIQADDTNSLKNKEGDALYTASIKICAAKVPECAADLSMLKMMYAQNVKSDCTAYENELSKQKTASGQKLAAAQKALRETALESFKSANKFDLGQCTVEFKKCMSTTAGCKDDFTGCVGIAAAENAQKSSSAKTVAISGAYTKISIAASTLDALTSKRPMCESVTNSCVNVKNQVWDTFLREVGPTLKSAELNAESDLRQNCISNISTCFQKACKDTIDPNDKDGSYDMCLSRPETVKSLCRVQIDPCIAAEPQVLDFVYAKLASMRVDSCTKEVKECLQSDDRCGSDYTKCIGLDTDSIIKMCPADKLVGCQKTFAGQSITGEAVYTQMSSMIQGIMLNIDNNFVTYCQKAADEAMVKICGGTENCDQLNVDTAVGTRGLSYSVCKGSDCSLKEISQISNDDLRNDSISITTTVNGSIDWSKVAFGEDGKITSTAVDATGKAVAFDSADLLAMQTSLNNTISTIESDAKVQYCITGRQVQGMEDQKIGREGNARFPDLTKQMRQTIGLSVIKLATENYYKKYSELTEKAAKDGVSIAIKKAEIKQQDALQARRNAGRPECMKMVDGSYPAANDLKLTTIVQTGDAKDWRTWIRSEFDNNNITCKVCTVIQRCSNWQHSTWFRHSKCLAWDVPPADASCKTLQF